jgi:hypothetical protein
MRRKRDTHSRDIMMKRLKAQKTLIEVVLMRGKLTYHAVEGNLTTNRNGLSSRRNVGYGILYPDFESQ